MIIIMGNKTTTIMEMKTNLQLKRQIIIISHLTKKGMVALMILKVYLKNKNMKKILMIQAEKKQQLCKIKKELQTNKVQDRFQHNLLKKFHKNKKIIKQHQRKHLKQMINTHRKMVRNNLNNKTKVMIIYLANKYKN